MQVIEKHTTIRSIELHLLPGVLIGCFYFLARQPVIGLGYPPMFALILAVAVVLIPFELGFLLYQSKKKTGRYDLGKVVSYLNPIPWWKCVVWAIAVFTAAGAVFIPMRVVDTYLKDNLFSWLPSLDMGLGGTYSRSALIVTYALWFVFITVLGPLVEELYFRGYLLPRIKGRFAFLLHSFLFAAYHTFTPWMILTRTLGFLPLIFAVKKKNIYVGMISHILMNTIDLIAGVTFILKMV